MFTSQRTFLISILAAAVQFTAQPPAIAQTQASSIPVITLAKSSSDTPEAAGAPSPGGPLAFKASYRAFASTKLGESSAPQPLTFEFHQTTQLTAVSARGDFRIAGSTCIEGHTYAEGNTCSVEVVFTPRGPGHRSGTLAIAHTASPKPLLTPIGGYASGPVISFIPAQIATVPGTNTGGGTLNNPQGLTVDGGDNLYIADTGNNLIKFIDSSGSIVNLIGGGTIPLIQTNLPSEVQLAGPSGVAVDTYGDLYFTDTGSNLVGVEYPDKYIDVGVGQGSSVQSGCNYSHPCTPYGVTINPPTSMAIDTSGSVYFAETYGDNYPGSLIGEWTNPIATGQYYTLYGPEYYIFSSSNAITVDPFGYGNLYYTYLDPGIAAGGQLSPTPLCYIIGQNSAASDGSSSGARYWIVAGSGQCGFSGDGGKATGARIGNAIGAFAWDAAGNFYFTDTANNRIRRVDGLTGIIRTVAGNGSKGDIGDRGPATSAPIDTPYGLAVDSQGQVYTTNLINSGPQAEIRLVTATGQLTFPSQALSTSSAAQTILVSNTGNDTLNFTHAGLSSGNTADFAIDPNTTSCNFTMPLDSGKSCTIGVIFTPSVSGARTAVLTLLDDTVTGQNPIQLSGTGGSAAAGKGALSPTSTAFAATAVSVASAAKSVTLSNTGTGSLAITTFTFSGTNAADFTQTNNCGSSLAASATCTISLTFTPAAVGARSASLAIATAAGTLAETLTGTGAAPGQGVFSPSSLTFGSQTVATASPTQVLTLKNTGGANLTLSAYTLGGTNPTSFTQTHTCSTFLSPGNSCTYTVTFKPTAAGALSATLTANTGAGPVTATLSGTGVAAAVKPKVTLLSSANPASAGQTIALHSQVLSATQFAPTGKVRLQEGTTLLATATLSAGTASFHLPSLSPGNHTLKATYLGDSHNKPMQSANFVQVVAAKKSTQR